MLIWISFVYNVWAESRCRRWCRRFSSNEGIWEEEGIGENEGCLGKEQSSSTDQEWQAGMGGAERRSGWKGTENGGYVASVGSCLSLVEKEHNTATREFFREPFISW